MFTTEEYLNQLDIDKATLKQNVASKGITVTPDDNFTTLSKKVNDIDIESAINNYLNLRPNELVTSISNPWGSTKLIKNISNLELIIPNGTTNLASLFSGYKYEYVPKIVFGNEVNNINSLFQNCSSLLTVNLSGMNTINVTNFSYMFSYCSALTELDLSNINISNATNLQNMFAGCRGLTELDLSNFENTKSLRLLTMFEQCVNLTKIDMRKMTISNNTGSSNMFGGSAQYGVPDDCLIIVKDDTEKAYINRIFARLTNVKTVAEYEGS